MDSRAERLAPLLAPIAGSNPSGRSVRDDAVYLQLKALRRPAEGLIGEAEWRHHQKQAAEVARLAGTALATESKDLELAVWWTEAMMRRDGVAGFRDGLELMLGLLKEYWPTLFPEPDDGDFGTRRKPLGYLGLLAPVLQLSAVNLAGHAYYQYVAAFKAGTAADADVSDERTAQRDKLEAEQQPLIEAVLRDVDATPVSWYADAVRQLEESDGVLSEIEAIASAQLDDEAPSYGPLHEMVREMLPVFGALLRRRREQEPDAMPDVGAETVTDTAVPASRGASAPSASGSESHAEGDAVARVVTAAAAMRRLDLADPTPYALLRALRWQGLRPAHPGDPVPEPSLLHAPVTAARSRVKSRVLAGDHEGVLDGVEELMAGTPGGAWLDAQRWAVDAADALGSAYAPVAQLLRTTLRQLLTTFPGLPHAMLLDDSPVANADTQAWLARNGLLSSPAASSGDTERMPVTPPAHRPMLERARAEVQAGRLDRGVALLMSDLARERSERARFLRRLEIVSVLLDASQASVAMPIVEDIVARIEAHKLEEWEDGSLVASALVLACRAIDSVDGDTSRRAEWYLRICRLDPVAALALG